MLLRVATICGVRALRLLQLLLRLLVLGLGGSLAQRLGVSGRGNCTCLHGLVRHLHGRILRELMVGLLVVLLPMSLPLPLIVGWNG